MAEASDLRRAHRDECLARRPYWIGGVPTPADVAAVSLTIARRLKVPIEEVEAALAEDGPIPA